MDTTDSELDYFFDVLMEVAVSVRAGSEQDARAVVTAGLRDGVYLEKTTARGVRLIEADVPIGHVPTLHSIGATEVAPRVLGQLGPDLNYAGLLAEAADAGLLDAEALGGLAARTGLSDTQVAELIGRAQAVWKATQDAGGVLHIEQARVVPDCGITGCPAPAAQVMTYSLGGAQGVGQLAARLTDRLVDLVCDEHVEYYRRERGELSPRFQPLPVEGASTVPAEKVMPWTTVWTVPGLAEWEVNYAWRWVVLETATVRDRRTGEPRVRWTYADGRVQFFGYGQPVTGWFSPGQPL
jgi:hypothetical protein